MLHYPSLSDDLNECKSKLINIKINIKILENIIERELGGQNLDYNEQHNIASAIGNATKTAALRYY